MFNEEMRQEKATAKEFTAVREKASPVLEKMKYQIIYADPPWSYNNSGFSYAAAKQYPTMSTEHICSLDIGSIAAENATLFCWGTWPLLPDALRVIEAWGFKYKTVAFVWLKTRHDANQYALLPENRLHDSSGMGFWTMSNTEFCLLAQRGRTKRIAAGIRQVIYSPLREHSRKPEEARTRIVQLMGDLPRVELFAREKFPGWDVWGNEVESAISLDSGNKEKVVGGAGTVQVCYDADGE